MSCRTCDRLDCSQRAFPPLHKKFDVDINTEVSQFMSEMKKIINKYDKVCIPAVIVFLIVLFWEKINETIYKKFKVKINYIIAIMLIAILLIISSLLYY